MKRRLLFLLFVYANTCFAQSMLRFQHLNVEDGLSQSSVYSIFQDSYGFVWLATGDGLDRYDGREFITYKSKLGESHAGQLKDRNINSAVYEDVYDNIWFTADEGVYRMDRRRGRFDVIINKYETWHAATVAGVDEKYTWVVVPGKGVFSIDVNNMNKRLYPFTDSFQSHLYDFTVIKNSVIAEEGLWIADVHGLLFFDKKTLRDKRILLQEGINNVCRLKNGVLLLAAANGVWLFDVVKARKDFLPITDGSKQTAQWNSIVEDKVSGTVYIAELHGGAICKLNLATHAYEVLHFQHNDINRLYADASQNLWVGTEGGGVYKLDIKPPKFFCYAPEKTQGEGFMVKSIYRSDSGQIWMGVFDKGLIKYDPETKKEATVIFGGAGSGIHTANVFRDSAGDIAMTMNDKILWSDANSGVKKQQLTLVNPATAKSPVIYALAEWKKGHYMAGTNMGLYSVSNLQGRTAGTIYPAIYRDSFINGWIYNIHNAGNGVLYIGKRSGFAKIRMINDSLPELLGWGLRGLPVRHFYKSSATPILWVATEQGLVAFNEATGKYSVFDERSGIANSYVYAILPENDSTLWVSTNNGISRVAVHYGDCSNITARFNNYTSGDGLQSNEFNTGAYFKCKDGTLMFGGIAGINWFNPRSIQANPYKAVPAVAGVYVDDTLVAGDTAMYMHELRLPYNRNTISFTLRALEYTQPERNVYAYMLEGMDNDWVYTNNDKVRYANLTPGTYRFLLKVRNNETLWNERPLSLLVVISPPYWQTWWFRLLVALVFASAVFGIVRYYIQQKVRLKTRELEKQHALNMERLRISKDVHDDIGSGLSKISLLSEMANRKINDNQSPGKDIGSISAISKELVDNMRDLIWVLNPENTTLDNLVSRMREYCADYLDGTDIEPVFDFPLTVPDMNISREVQRNIFSTVKEAVNNCMKYAGASEIKISVILASNMLSLTIADNGSGFVIGEAGNGGNGLRNMRQRMESIGGTCTITSVAGQGTTVHAVIPVGRLNKA